MRYSYTQFDGKDLAILRLPPGAGLSNLLFPWAKFIVATRKYSLTPICPTWLQLPIGNILRGEPDKRFYHDLFRTPEDQISGIKKIYLLTKLRKVTETEFKSNPYANKGSDYIVVFGGRYKGFFSEVLRDHELVFKELLDITLDKHKKGLEYNFKGAVSLHVRLGDFFSANRQSTLKGALNYRIPIEWYIQQVNQIRQFVGREVPVYLFSDGKDSELAELLNLPNIRRITFGSSIADMLALANATVLVGSGSTFSMWASYLGRMPAIWHKGQRKQRLYYEDISLEIETDEEGNLRKDFLEKVATRLEKD